jgi:hypothetical protein
MTEINNTPPPPPPPPPPIQPGGATPQPDPEQQEPGLREELAKARSRNKLLVTLSVVLGTIFVLLAGAGYIVYTKVNAAKDNLQEIFNALPPPPAGYQPDNRTLPVFAVSSSTSIPVSSLGLFSGGLPDAGPGAGKFDPVQAQQAAKAMLKYSERPVVKEFMADLKKMPELKGVFDGSRANNPLGVIAALQNAKGMNKVVAKYATRPDFIALMMEAMNDPEMEPLLKGMPGMPAMPTMPGQQVARPVSTLPPPGSGGSGDEEDGEDEEMTFDPSAISGPSKPAPAPSRKAPPPVDRD